MAVIIKPGPTDPVTNSIWLEDTETGEQYFLDGGDGQDVGCDVETGDDPWWSAFVSGCDGKSREEADEWLDEHADCGSDGWELPSA